MGIKFRNYKKSHSGTKIKTEKLIVSKKNYSKLS